MSNQTYRRVRPFATLSRAAGVGLAVMALLCACSSAGGGAASPVAQPSPTSLKDQCFEDFGDEVRTGVLTAPSGAWLHTATVGESDTVAILLHQTNGGGLCGFIPYALQLADQGIRAELFDLCGYGQSVCDPEPAWAEEPVRQIEQVVEKVRDDGAERVVLVGASMGGSLALQAAPEVDADAVVDLSGPAQFSTADVTVDAGKVTMPVLIGFSGEDRNDMEEVEKAMASMPAETKKFVEADSGHGYTMLNVDEKWTDLAGRVADWVKGDY